MKTVKTIMSTFNDTIKELKDYSAEQRAAALNTEAELVALRKKKEVSIQELKKANRIAAKLAKVIA